MNKKLWIVADTEDYPLWHVKGIFSTKQAAIDVCTKSAHCVMDIILDEIQPDEIETRGFYPHQGAKMPNLIKEDS